MSDAGRDKFNQGLELESVLNELIVEEELDGCQPRPSARLMRGSLTMTV